MCKRRQIQCWTFFDTDKTSAEKERRTARKLELFSNKNF